MSSAGVMRKASGSSPLTRGKPAVRDVSIHVRGLIPAHAGKTSYHPPLRVLEGLIPAHAGKTECSPTVAHVWGAHPRSRGENDSFTMRNGPTRGSSPLTRGKRAPGRGCRHRRGLIPAHAGKTSGQGRARSRRRAHPRSRGENVVCFCAPSAVQGSSPLTRGKPDLRVGGLCRLRLIPAHAGKTRSPGTPIIVPGAHPRSRGENEKICQRVASWAGSSPLTRGKREHGGDDVPHGGLIPAHAGKT